MARIIQCDGCKASMPLDGKGVRWKYHEICVDGKHAYDLCFCCYFTLMRDILRIIPKEDPNGGNYEEEEV